MTAIWGIHNDHPELALVENGFVSIGWDELGDLRAIGDDREKVKSAIAAAYPDAKLGAIPVWAGVCLRFAYRIEPGDLVIYPHKPDSTLSFGRVAGDYSYDESAPFHRHRRSVEWLKTGVPRADFSQSALYEVGSAVTLFSVKKHAAEYLKFVYGEAAEITLEPLSVGETDTPEGQAEDAPNAVRIEEHTRDFVIDALYRRLTGHEFEAFVAGLLRAMGYRAEVTQASGDGGFDVVAHRDPLGIEPPIIKVQCKRVVEGIGAPEVQKLTGALSPGGQELGLFVSLGSFSRDAMHLERSRQDLRLVGGKELVDLVFEHYERLSSEWKRLLPMRSVYVVDQDPQIG